MPITQKLLCKNHPHKPTHCRTEHLLVLNNAHVGT